MFHESGYTSVSVVGLCVIIIVSAIITIISYMDGVLALLMWKRWPHRVLAWRTDTYLQLLRLVNENKRIRTWKQGLHEIPVTEKGETLGVVEVVEGRIGIARVSSRISTSDLRPADDLAQGRWSRIVADLVLMCCSDFWLRGTDCVYLLFLYFAVRHPFSYTTAGPICRPDVIFMTASSLSRDLRRVVPLYRAWVAVTTGLHVVLLFLSRRPKRPSYPRCPPPHN
jgi:hypothetical protein